MKQLLLLIILFSITTASFSQINKGQWLVGGNANFNSNKKELTADFTTFKDKTNTFQLSPNVGYFITDKLAAGARISYTTVKNDKDNYNDYYETSRTDVSLSPFIRYYFLPKKERLNLFADAGYTYGRYRSEYKLSSYPSSSTSKGTSNGYYISAGPAIFLNPNTALELTLSYNYNKQKEYNYNDRNLMVGVGFQIHLGK